MAMSMMLIVMMMLIMMLIMIIAIIIIISSRKFLSSSSPGHPDLYEHAHTAPEKKGLRSLLCVALRDRMTGRRHGGVTKAKSPVFNRSRCYSANTCESCLAKALDREKS